MPTLLAYVLLFTGIGAFFIFIHLLIGKLVRPNRPDAEKATVYECGEPTIGSAWVQFDLRFYVVALLFVIFDVEVAFFFPWAVVFGKANHLAKPDLPTEQRLQMTEEMMPRELWLSRSAVSTDRTTDRWPEFEASVRNHNGPLRTPSEREAGKPVEVEQSVPQVRQPTPAEQSRDAAESFAWTAFLDILVFFGVLLVGFAYLWRRGDLNWVRSLSGQQPVSRESGVEGRESQSLPSAAL